MTCGVYIIYNTFNNKVYIGQSINIEDRWKRHSRELELNKHHSYKLQQEYVKDKFIHEVLVKCEPNSLSDTEYSYIQEFDSYYNGYNCTTGQAVSGIGYTHSMSVYEKETYIKVVQYLAYSSISQKDISKELEVSENIIHNISTLRRHNWIEYEMPLEYDILKNKYESINTRPRGSNPDIEKVFKELVNTSNSLDIIESRYSLTRKQIQHLLYGEAYKWLSTIYPIEYPLLKNRFKYAKKNRDT